MKLTLATRNRGKLREFQALLLPHEVLALPDAVELPQEIGSTFQDNAVLKAEAARDALDRAVVADDSGIEAAALGGAPGVRSARFAGENATDAENLQKLRRALADASDRRVRYVCVLALARPQLATECFVGICAGIWTDKARGSGGFGYDPCFVPADYDDARTMAELSQAEKDAISHRGRAARSLLHWLATLAHSAGRA